MKKYLVFIWILALSCLVYTHAQVATSDSLALVAFYDSTNGPNWTNNSNWLQPGQPVSSWYGIYTNTSGDHVTSIFLINNNLTGHLPAAMFDLPELEYLMLYNNGIGGTIPEEAGNLNKLIILSLAYNQLIGEIPPQLGMLDNLTTLELSYNDLTGSIPVALCNLPNLLIVALRNNHLDGNIPSTIGNLTNLNGLYLSGNDLYDPIPVEIGNLTGLVNLELDSNHLSGPIPTEIGNLTNLKDLELNYNEFTGSIPNSICNLTDLWVLFIGNNKFTGSLPSGLKSMSALDLRIQMNQFTFSDLEPLAGNTLSNFEYSPQRQIPINPMDTTVTSGDDLVLDISDLAIPDITATNNQYQWGLDGSYITSPGTSPTLNLDDIEYSSQGYYHCLMTNSDFPLLNLTTDSIAVWVKAVPDDITLSDTTVDENVLSGTLVGSFTVSDEDQTGNHILTFATGNGSDDADNSLFILEEDELLIDTSPDYEIKSQYHIKVRATDNDANSIEKAFIIYVNDLPDSTLNGIEDGVPGGLKIYPNPTHGRVWIDLSSEITEYTLEIYDVAGNRLIKGKTTKGNIVDLTPYPTGTYFLTFKTNDHYAVCKIIKQ